LTITDPCPTATLTIVTTNPPNPFVGGIEYVIGDAATILNFDADLIVQSSTAVDCGPIEIDWTQIPDILAPGTTSPLDAGLFDDSPSSTGGDRFTTGPTDDINEAGTKYVKFTASYKDYPSATNQVDSNPIQVEIIDPCDPPAGFTQPTVLPSSPVD
jgi:hypothetical protein